MDSPELCLLWTKKIMLFYTFLQIKEPHVVWDLFWPCTCLLGSLRLSLYLSLSLSLLICIALCVGLITTSSWCSRGFATNSNPRTDEELLVHMLKEPFLYAYVTFLLLLRSQLYLWGSPFLVRFLLKTDVFCCFFLPTK